MLIKLLFYMRNDIKLDFFVIKIWATCHFKIRTSKSINKHSVIETVFFLIKWVFLKAREWRIWRREGSWFQIRKSRDFCKRLVVRGLKNGVIFVLWYWCDNLRIRGEFLAGKALLLVAKVMLLSTKVMLLQVELQGDLFLG